MSWAVWVTGPPGSGKSVVARAAAEVLRARGTPVEILELDAMRKVVTPAPTYSEGERTLVYRALTVLPTLALGLLAAATWRSHQPGEPPEPASDA